MELDEPQAATAPGQYAVFYDGDIVLGAGVIASSTRFRTL
ncbi:MAG: aminomethyltransferase beta-barrel domain-containing protein [Eggerthellaceae bacterium]